MNRLTKNHICSLITKRNHMWDGQRATIQNPSNNDEIILRLDFGTQSKQNKVCMYSVSSGECRVSNIHMSDKISCTSDHIHCHDKNISKLMETSQITLSSPSGWGDTFLKGIKPDTIIMIEDIRAQYAYTNTSVKDVSLYFYAIFNTKNYTFEDYKIINFEYDLRSAVLYENLLLVVDRLKDDQYSKLLVLELDEKTQFPKFVESGDDNELKVDVIETIELTRITYDARYFGSRQLLATSRSLVNWPHGADLSEEQSINSKDCTKVYLLLIDHKHIVAEAFEMVQLAIKNDQQKLSNNPCSIKCVRILTREDTKRIVFDNTNFLDLFRWKSIGEYDFNVDTLDAIQYLCFRNRYLFFIGGEFDYGSFPLFMCYDSVKNKWFDLESLINWDIWSVPLKCILIEENKTSQSSYNNEQARDSIMIFGFYHPGIWSNETLKKVTQVNMLCMPWEMERLLWIAHYKNSNNDQCYMYQMSKDIIKYIIGFIQCFILDDSVQNMDFLSN